MRNIYIYLTNNKASIYKEENSNFINLKIFGEKEFKVEDIESILELKEYILKTYFDNNEERNNLNVKVFYDYTVNRQTLGNFIIIFSMKVEKDYYNEKEILHRLEAINVEDLDNINNFLLKDEEKIEEKKVETNQDEILEYEKKIEELKVEIKNLKKNNKDLRISLIELEKKYKLELLNS